MSDKVVEQVDSPTSKAELEEAISILIQQPYQNDVAIEEVGEY